MSEPNDTEPKKRKDWLGSCLIAFLIGPMLFFAILYLLGISFRGLFHMIGVMGQ